MTSLQNQNRNIHPINGESFHSYRKIKQIVNPKQIKDADIFSIDIENDKKKIKKKQKKPLPPSKTFDPTRDLKQPKTLTALDNRDIPKKFKRYKPTL